MCKEVSTAEIQIVYIRESNVIFLMLLYEFLVA